MDSLYKMSELVYQVIESGFVEDESTGEVFDSSDLGKLVMDLTDKVENCGFYIKNTRAMAEAMRKEEIALAERRRKLEKRADKLEEYVGLCLSIAGKTKLETPRVAVISRKSVSVEIDDEKQIDPLYMTIKTELKPNKTMIKKALQEGKTLDGCHLENKTNWSVK